MQAIEFEAIPYQHSIHLPEQIPDGIKLRVLVLMEDTELEPSKGRKKVNRPSPQLLGSVKMTDDLILPAVPESDWNALNDRS